MNAEIAPSTGLHVDGIGCGGAPPHLKIQIAAGTEADGRAGILDEQPLDRDALAIGGADIHRRCVFDTLKHRDIASAADGERTGSGRSRRRSGGRDETHRDRVIGLEKMGVVVLDALNFGLLNVIGLFAQETATGRPFSGGHLGSALIDLLVINLVGRSRASAEAARCRSLESLPLQQGLGIGDLRINRGPIITLTGWNIEEEIKCLLGPVFNRGCGFGLALGPIIG